MGCMSHNRMNGKAASHCGQTKRRLWTLNTGCDSGGKYGLAGLVSIVSFAPSDTTRSVLLPSPRTRGEGLGVRGELGSGVNCRFDSRTVRQQFGV